MEAAEFDKFADEYLAIHTDNLKISGERPDYFARYKIDELRRRWSREKRPEPRAILDFGSGVGASLPHLAQAFPSATLTAIDVSERSLEISRQRYPELGARVLYSGRGDLPLEAGGFDLVFTACVFHHIDADQHVELFGRLRKLLRPGGVLMVFEHNPVNPVTRYIVATCPFDENAVLIPGPVLRARLRAAGFAEADVRYTGFFPHALAALRPMEPWLAPVPVGAQYYAFAQA
ncbi:MAG TPA: class I SAM-dependent methyltransferase [Caulobacteraceae bacterium]